MPKDDPSLREAVTTAVKDQSIDPAAAVVDASAPKDKGTKAPDTQTREEVTDGLTAHDKRLIEAGGLSEEQFTQLPEETQQSALKLFRSYDKGFHKDRTRVSELMKIQDQIEEHPGLEDDLKRVISQRINGTGRTTAPERKQTETIAEVSPAIGKTLKGFDKLIDQAQTPDDRERLRETKQVVLEEFQELVNQEVTPLKQEVERLRSLSTSRRLPDIDKAINALEDKQAIPPAIVEKYRRQLTTQAVKFPDLTMRRLLLSMASEEETDQIMNSSKESKTSGHGSPRTTPVAPVNVSTSSGGEKEMERHYKGPPGKKSWDIGGLLRSIANK